MKNKILKVLPIVFLSVSFCSCSSSFMKKNQEIKPTKIPSVIVSEPVVTTQGVSNRDYYATSIDGSIGASGLSPSLEERIIYFNYDSSKVPEKFLNLVRLHASSLTSDRGISVTLEGHSDERGSREYNLALGERRAMAVRQQLILFGVPASQLTTVSYGEEKPADDGHHSRAYEFNRRVELRY